MLSVVTPSTVEPVSIAEVKAHSLIDHNHQDDVIAGFITAARQYCEAYLNRKLTGGTNALRLSMDGFCDPRYVNCGVIELPQPPLASSTSVAITYTNSTGGTSTFASSDYIVDSYSEPARIAPAWNAIYPVTQQVMNAVTITYTAGYSTASEVPQGIRTAIKMLAAHWFESREPIIVGTIVADLPFGLNALLDPHKWGAYP